MNGELEVRRSEGFSFVEVVEKRSGEDREDRGVCEVKGIGRGVVGTVDVVEGGG